MEKQVANVQLMQKMNRLKVLNYVRRNPKTSRPIVAEKTGLSLASITNVTSYLLKLGLLEECGTEHADRVGRKSTLLQFRADRFGLIIALLDESNAKIFYTDLGGKILSSFMVAIKSIAPANVISILKNEIVLLMDKHGVKNTLGIGVIFSGLVLDGSRFVFSSSMKWHRLEIKEILEQETGLPVFVDNISRIRAADFSATTERELSKNMLFVDLENGIGAVQIYNGVINHSFLGEIGHTTIEKNGEPCFCGNQGCLEVMCSVERILRLYAEKSGKSAELAEIETLYQKGDEPAVYAVSDCAQYLGIGLANLINLLNPAVLVLNTGNFSNCPSLLEKAIDHMKKRSFLALTQVMQIITLSLNSEDILSSAAIELCDRLFDISYSGNIISSPIDKH